MISAGVASRRACGCSPSLRRGSPIPPTTRSTRVAPGAGSSTMSTAYSPCPIGRCPRGRSAFLSYPRIERKRWSCGRNTSGPNAPHSQTGTRGLRKQMTAMPTAASAASSARRLMRVAGWALIKMCALPSPSPPRLRYPAGAKPRQSPAPRIANTRCGLTCSSRTVIGCSARQSRSTSALTIGSARLESSSPRRPSPWCGSMCSSAAAIRARCGSTISLLCARAGPTKTCAPTPGSKTMHPMRLHV